MIECPDRLTLLAFLDGELGETEARQIRQHSEECRYCSRRLQEINDTYHLCRDHLHKIQKSCRTLEILGQEEVWNQIKPTLGWRRKQRMRRIQKTGAAVALLAAFVMVLSIPSVQVLAENLLQVFRVQKVQTLTLTADDMNLIQARLSEGGTLDIDQFGTIEALEERQVQPITAEELDSLSFTPLLPAAGSVDLLVEDIPDVQLTLNVEGVNHFIASLEGTARLPRELDGKAFKFIVPEQLVVDYDHGRIIQGPSPELEVPAGVDVNQVAQAMIDLPIWPDSVRRQLQAVGDWSSTLIVPGTEDQARNVKINGQDGVLITTEHDCMLVWKQGDMLLVAEDFAGNSQRLIETAESLR